MSRIKKDLYFQELRGLAIFAVVLIHALGSVLSLEIKGSFPWNHELTLIFRQFISFPVPLFFFVSGYFVNKEEILAGNLKEFYKRRLLKIFIPYLFWSFSVLTINKFYGFDLTSITFNLLTGQVVGIYYFIIVLMQFILITPFLVKAIEKGGKLYTLLWFTTPISLTVLYLVSLLYTKVVFPWNALWFPIWFLFYFYGLAIKNQKLPFRLPDKVLTSLVFYLFFLVISFVEAALLSNISGLEPFSLSSVKFSSFLTAFLLINLLLILKPYGKHSGRLLRIFGDYSFGIYLIHIFILPYVFSFLIRFKFTYYSQIVSATIIATITLFISLFIIKLCQKIFGKRLSKKVLGF